MSRSATAAVAVALGHYAMPVPSAEAAPVYYDNNTGTGAFTGATWTPNQAGGSGDVALAAGSDVDFGSNAVTLATLSTITTSALALNSFTFLGANGNTGGYTFTNAGQVILGNATTSSTAAAPTLLLSSTAGPVTFSGNVQFTSSSAGITNYIVNNSASSLITFAGLTGLAVSGSTTTLAIAGTGTGGVTFSGGIDNNQSTQALINSGGGNVNLTVTGGGVVTFGGIYIPGGITTVGSGGSVLLGSAQGLYDSALNLTGGAFSFGTQTAPTIAALEGTGDASTQLVLTNTLGQAVNLTLQGFGQNNTSAKAGDALTYSGKINGLGGLTINGALNNNRSTGGTATFSGVLSFTGGLTLSNTPTYGTTNGTSTIVLSGADTYQGATTAATGINLTISGNTGADTGTSGYTFGSGDVFQLTPGTTNTTNMLNSAANITLSGAGTTVALTGNGTNSVTETFNSLAFGQGNDIITITGAGGTVTKLVAGAASNSFSRSGNATLLIRGTNLNQTSATNVSRFTLGDGGASLGLVGTNTLTGGATNDATQALKISPFIFGDSAVAGNGTNFVTYDNTLGIRLLTAAEDTALVAGSTTAASPVNATVATNSATVTASALTVNSLLFTTTGLTLDGTSTALTVNSGAVAESVAAGTIGSNFISLTLGGEGVITTPSGDTLTINTPIAVTSSGGLTKAGAGTLVIGATATYTGATTINQGALAFSATGNLSASSTLTVTPAGTLTNTATASLASPVVITAGATVVPLTGTTFTLAGNVSGAGGITQNVAAGTLSLAGSNSYSGATALSAGTLQAVASVANLTGANSTALSANSVLTINGGTLALRADANSTFTVNAASGTGNNNVNIDVNKISTGSNNVLTLNGLTTITTTGRTLTVSGGSGDTLALGAIVYGDTNGGAWTVSATTANVTLASITPNSGNNYSLTLNATASTGNVTVTGPLQYHDNGHNLSLTLAGSGLVTLNGSNVLTPTSGADPASIVYLQSGTLVLNGTTGFNGNSATGPLELGNVATSSTAATLLLGGGATGLTGGTTFTALNNGNLRPIVAEDKDTALLTLGGQNTSGTNTFNSTITLGSTLNTGKSITVQQAAGGTTNFSGNILANGTDTTAGVTVGGTTATTANTGIVQFTGANTYHGNTTVNSGTLALKTGSLATSSVSVGAGSSAATLSIVGSYTLGTATSGAVSLAATNGNLSLVDSAVNTLTIPFAGAALTLNGGGSLGYEISGATADQIALTGTGASVSATGTTAVNVTILSKPTSSASLPLIIESGTSPAGGINANGTTNNYSLSVFNAGGSPVSLAGTSFSLSNNAAFTQLILNETVTPSPSGNLYFTGLVDNVWGDGSNNGTSSNWSINSSGTPDAGTTPGAVTDVHFYATSLPTNATNNSTTAAALLATSLGNIAYTVDSVNVDGTTLNNPSVAVSIASGGSNGILTIAPTSSSNGISVGAGGQLTVGAPIVLGAPQTWTNDPSNSTPLLINGNISGTSANTLKTVGAVTLAGTNTYAGATTVNSGVLNLTGSLSGTNISVVGGSFTEQASGSIGTGATTFANSGGNVTFSGTNAFTGATTLSGGTTVYSGTMGATAIAINGTGLAQLGTATGLTAINNVTVSGNGQLDLAGNNVTLGAVTNAATAGITNSGASATLTMGNGSGQSGGGTTGALTIIQNLVATASTDAGTYSNTGNLTFNLTAAGNLTASGTFNNTGNITVNQSSTGALATTGGTFTNTGNITLNANSATAIAFGANINNTGGIINSGTSTGITTLSGALGTHVGVVTETSSNSNLALSGNSPSWAGGLTVSNGVVNIGAATANANLGTGAINLGTTTTNAALTFSNAAVASFPYTNTINVGGSGTDTISDGSGVLNFNGAGATVVLSNSLTVTNSNGAGTNINFNTVTGTGNVTLNSTGNGAQYAFATTGGASFTGNFILNGTTNGAITGGLLNNTGNITNQGTGVGTTTTIGGTIGSQVTQIIENSAGSTLVSSVSNSANQSTTTYLVNQGTLNFDNGQAGNRYMLGSITLNAALGKSAALTTNSTNGASGAGGGQNTIYVTGAGTNLVTAPNGNDDFEGPVIITEGDSLTVDPVTNDGNHTWNFAANGASAQTINSQGTGSTASVLTLENNTTAGNCNLNVGTINIVGSVINTATHAQSSAAPTTLAGIGANVIAITQNSIVNNNLVINGTNTTSTETVLATAGTIQVGSATAFNAANIVTVNGALLAPAGALDLNGLSTTIGGLNGATNTSQGVVTNSNTSTASTLTIGSTTNGITNTSYTYGGNVTNGTKALNLVVALGSGDVQTFGSTSSNTYTGTTTVNSGKFVLNGTHTGGAGYTISSGSAATFSGTGSTASAVTVNAAGVVEPGNGLGSGALTVGGISGTATALATSGSSLQADINFGGAGTPPDTAGELIIPASATGSPVSLSGLILNLNLINSASAGGSYNETFVLIDNKTTETSAAEGTFANILPVTGAGSPYFTYTVAYGVNSDGDGVGNDVTLNVTAVPEPTSLGLLGLGGLGLMRRRRKTVAKVNKNA